MLAAVIKGPTLKAAQEQIQKALPFADLLELRLDYFEDEALLQLSQLTSSLPFIFTFRKKEQGGARAIAEEDRLKKFEDLLSFGPAYCDLETDTDPEFIRKIRKKFPQIQLIGSFHDFEKTPKDLQNLLETMQNPHFAIYKIVTYANSTIDLLRLMTFAKENGKKVPLTCIAMGELGRPSRVLGPIIGNAIDYAALEEGQDLLFQYSLKTLHEQFHYRSLNRESQIFALIGNPVIHSSGDLFHNEIFREKGKNAVYIKLQLDPHELSEFFPFLHILPFKGLSVTIPLKEAILPFLDRIDPIALQIGAVNTISLLNCTSLGTNTDAPGALNAIEQHFAIQDKKVAILGAGGTARAIAYEAKKRGAQVSIFNRTEKRAQMVASDLGVQAYPIEQIVFASYDLLINTIPEFDHPLSLCKAVVMDVVRYPKETLILKKAKQRGLSCIYGDEMFVEQAKLQQINWDK